MPVVYGSDVTKFGTTCAGRQKTIMADHKKAKRSSVKATMSDYVVKLTVEARERYLTKLRYRQDTCALPGPYCLSDGWVDDLSLWP